MMRERLIVLVLAAGLACRAAGGARPLRIYCVYHAAHGLRAIGRDYRKRTGVGLELRLHCRERFHATARSLADGDLFLTTSPTLFAEAAKLGLLASEPQRIGCVTPIIAVTKGNPHKIQSLADLARNGLVVAYPSTCIGNVSLNVIAKNHLEADVRPHMTIRSGNRTGVLRPLVDGKAQAALTWSCAVIESGRKDIDIVPIPKAQNIIDPIHLAILKTTRDRAQAQALIDHLRTEPVRKRLRSFRLLEAQTDDAR